MAHRVVMVPTKSHVRNPQHVVEVRGYHGIQNERHGAGERFYPIAPHVTPTNQRGRSHSQRNGLIIDARDGGVLEINEAGRKPLEYEDIYNTRVQPDTSRSSQRRSMRDEREDGGYRVVNGGPGVSRDPASTQRSTRSSGSQEGKERGSYVKENGIAVGTVESRVIRYIEGQRDARGTPGTGHEIGRAKDNNHHIVDIRTTTMTRQPGEKRGTRSDSKGSTNDDNTVNLRNTRDIKYPQEPRGVRDTPGVDYIPMTGKETRRNVDNAGVMRNLRDTMEEQRDIEGGNMSGGESRKSGNGGGMVDTRHVEDRQGTQEGTGDEFSAMKWSPHQTSFPRKVGSTGEQPSSRLHVYGVIINIQKPEDKPPSSATPIGIHYPSNDDRVSLDSDSSGNVPLNLLKPPSARPAGTTRSVSPAPSIASSCQSNMTQNSATSGKSEVSVKSILKKPKVGRVVLKEEPPAYSVLAVVSCILCFPFGIYALVKSNNVKRAVEENDYDWALSSSKKVKRVCIGIFLTYLGILVIGGVFLAKYFITGKLF